MNLHDIRQEYSQQKLSVKQCAASPFTQFTTWLNEAISTQVSEPTAMNIATVNAAGKPSARVVLLKEISTQGFVFFTNYSSQKGLDLSENPYAALTFFWPELERQVRAQGRVIKLPEAESDSYFASRPYGSRVGAWASHQSQVIESKMVLLKRAAEVAAQYPLHIPRPKHWGGYVVLPETIEFWQGRPSRLHDRIRYILRGDDWIKERLSP